MRPRPTSTLFPYTTLFRSRRQPVRPPRPPGHHRAGRPPVPPRSRRDRKSTRLNSSHTVISYAVFCLKKKKAITEYLHDVARYRALIATHYHKLAQVVATLPRRRNYRVLVQELDGYVIFLHNFFSTDAATTYINTLSLHDALPISPPASPTPAPPRSPSSRSTASPAPLPPRSEEHTSELQSHSDLVCRLLLEKKKGDHRVPA